MINDGLHKSEKELLRSRHIKAIKAMNEAERTSADRSITRNLIGTSEFGNARNIFTFVGVGHEINMYPIIESALKSGKRVYVPYCLGKGVMRAARLFSLDELRPGMYGIPTVSQQNETIEPYDIKLIAVPAVCYDRRGYRLGRGGGYYDRYLKRVSEDTVTVGVCRDAQLMDSLRVMPHDRRVKIIITENEIIRV